MISSSKNQHPASYTAGSGAGKLAETLRQIIGELAAELRPGRRGPLALTSQTRLDRDLGIDSLGLAELLTRIERAFGVRLPEDLLATAETVGDLLTAIAAAQGGVVGREEMAIAEPALEPPAAAPKAAETLTEILDRHVAEHPGRTHILLWRSGEEEPKITYAQLAERSLAVAARLRERGLEPGERVALMLPTGAEFFYAFLGILYAGGVPVPIYPPARLSRIEDHLRRQAGVLDNAGAVMLVTVPEAKTLARLLRALVPSLRSIETPDSLAGTGAGAGDERPAVAPRADDIAFLQYTSGSTGDPKGVVLTHRNLLANLKGIAEVLEPNSSDVMVSWLPLYHDMGLIGAWMGSLYCGAPLVLMSPLTFLAHPEQWLWAIHRHRGTLTAAPNFAYELAAQKIRDSDIEGLDLGSLRVAMNGAEPVSAPTIRRFTSRFAHCGFRPEAMMPVYGLAENSLAVTMARRTSLPVIDRVERKTLARLGEAVPAAAEEAGALEFVSCGPALPAHQVRIVDAEGRELGERREGLVEFRGPSATSGYFQNPAKTLALRHGDWLRTGDRGYLAAGETFITGRTKDIIIRAGRNIYPHEIEQAISDIEGIRKGCVAVFGSADPALGTERIIVVAETRHAAGERLVAIRRQIGEIAAALMDSPPDDIVFVPPQTVLKTSSGKVRRDATRVLYETGRLSRPQRALWLQLARLGARGYLGRLRRGAATALQRARGSFGLAVVGVGMLVAGCGVLLLPGLARRWAFVGAVLRLALRGAGVRLQVEGLGHLPERGGIVVVNHASYFDGLILPAALPGALRIMAKNDLASVFFLGAVLKRLGTLFVERADAAGGVEDFERAVAALDGEARLVFFPEGTFTRFDGLLEFRLGAFRVAARAGVAVTPVTLRGTRQVLRDKTFLPRVGPVKVTISEPQSADSDDFRAALRLRDEVRAAILKHCGEPDRAGEHVVFSSSGIEHIKIDPP